MSPMSLPSYSSPSSTYVLLSSLHVRYVCVQAFRNLPTHMKYMRELRHVVGARVLSCLHSFHENPTEHVTEATQNELYSQFESLWMPRKIQGYSCERCGYCWRMYEDARTTLIIQKHSLIFLSLKIFQQFTGIVWRRWYHVAFAYLCENFDPFFSQFRLGGAAGVAELTLHASSYDFNGALHTHTAHNTSTQSVGFIISQQRRQMSTQSPIAFQRRRV